MKMVERKILLIGRHGKALPRPGGGSSNTLVPETFPIIYSLGVGFQPDIQEYGITPDKTFLTHTPQIRTKYTGQIFLIGAFNFQPSEGANPPKSVEEIDRYNFAGIDTAADERFVYGYPGKSDDFNLKIYQERGSQPGIDYLLANPEAEEHEGEPIISGAIVMSNCKEGVKDNIKKLLSGEKDLGVLMSHAGRVDITVISLINSARNSGNYVEKIEDIGGTFNAPEFAKLIIDKTDGGLYTATLEHKGNKHNIDLNKI